MISEIRGKWPYNCYIVGLCFQDFFKTECIILVYFPFSLITRCFVRIKVVQLYGRTDIAAAWKNSTFILSARQDFHFVVKLFTAVHALSIRVKKLISADEILLPRYMYLLTDFRGMLLNEMAPSYSKQIAFFYLNFGRDLSPPVCPRICYWDSYWPRLHTRSARSSL